MENSRLLVLFIFVAFAFLTREGSALEKWETIQTRTSAQVQAAEVTNLLARLLPDGKAHLFHVKIADPSDAPKNKDRVSLVSYADGNGTVSINVTANTGVAAAWGVHHYLKYFCNSHISWDTVRIGNAYKWV